MTEIERLREALEPAPWCKDALFLITTHGDGAGAQLVRGWAALCETIVDVHYFEPDADQRAEVMHRLTAWDDWQNDDTGPYFLALDYEDGSVSITRVTEGAALSTPPAAERGEWQGMDSAPRDGTKIDLLYPYPRGRTVDCYWDDTFVKGWCWRTPVWKRGELLPESEWDWGSYPNATPLGWMPAPPSPRTPEGQ